MRLAVGLTSTPARHAGYGTRGTAGPPGTRGQPPRVTCVTPYPVLPPHRRSCMRQSGIHQLAGSGSNGVSPDGHLPLPWADTHTFMSRLDLDGPSISPYRRGLPLPTALHPTYGCYRVPVCGGNRSVSPSEQKCLQPVHVPPPFGQVKTSAGEGWQWVGQLQVSSAGGVHAGCICRACPAWACATAEEDLRNMTRLFATTKGRLNFVLGAGRARSGPTAVRDGRVTPPLPPPMG